MRTTRTLALSLLLSTATTAAHAMLPPEAYERARDEADVALTLTVSEVSTPSSTPGACRVEGAVAELTRDRTGRLAPGQALAFDVACSEEGDEIPAGGTLWTDVADLERASLIAAWLEPDGDGFRVARSQTEILRSDRTPPARFPWGLVAGVAFAVVAVGLALRGARRRA